MSIEIIELKVSQTIEANESVADFYVIPNNSMCDIKDFWGSTPFDSYSVVSLIWDFDSENPINLWTIRGYGQSPLLDSIVGDGIKKLAVMCINENSIAVSMSAKASLKIIGV